MAKQDDETGDRTLKLNVVQVKSETREIAGLVTYVPAEPIKIPLVVRRYVPQGGPVAIVPGDAAVGAEAMQSYLCSKCGQDGKLSKAWLDHVQFEGDVICPVCHHKMNEA